MTFVSRCSGLALLVLAACSDAVLPPSEGAFAFVFEAPSGCTIKTHTAQLGDVSRDGVSSFEIDGVNSADIYCQVRGEGSFYVDAFVGGRGKQISIEIDSIGADNDQSNPAEGSLRYLSATTAKAYTSPADEKCAFYIENDKQKVKSGAMFIGFKCPSLDNTETSPHSTCATGVGWIALQICDT
jgi:hypothetical protein